MASAPCAAREHDVAVGEFFDFRFVALRCRTCVDGSQGVPCASEVVGVHHTVTAGACAECGVDAVVFPHLDDAALADASASEEEALHGAQRALVEEAVDTLCDFLRSIPCDAVVV